MEDYTIKSILRSLVLDYLAGAGIENVEFATNITEFTDEYSCVGEDKEQYDFIEEMWTEQVCGNLKRECNWMEARVNNKIKPAGKTAPEYSTAIVEFLKQDIDWPEMYWTVETIYSDDSLEVMCPAYRRDLAGLQELGIKSPNLLIPAQQKISWGGLLR